MIHASQCTTGHEIVDQIQLTPWVILKSQMQSGKTGTYLFAAAEMIRLELVSRVVLLSGNADTALYNQCHGAVKEFIPAYLAYYCTTTTARVQDLPSRCATIQRVAAGLGAIQIVFGQHMGAFANVGGDVCGAVEVINREKTLYILDESHVAQNKGMRPSRLFEQLGIDASGDTEKLEKARAYVISVSATPFSEISDNYYIPDAVKEVAEEFNLNRQVELAMRSNYKKGEVILVPGPEYMGVRKMQEFGMIKGFYPMRWQSTLADILDSGYLNEVPRYMLVRTVADVSGLAQELLQKYPNLSIRTYDSDRGNPFHLSSLALLKKAPDKHTLIFVKGMCRMGQVIHKEHLGILIETSKESNTDVVLQGFVGRVCGYHSYTHIRIYIAQKVMSKNQVGISELDRYVRFAEKKNMVVPRKGRNLRGGSGGNTKYGFPIIPIQVVLDPVDQGLMNPGSEPEAFTRSVLSVLVSKWPQQTKQADAQAQHQSPVLPHHSGYTHGVESGVESEGEVINYNDDLQTAALRIIIENLDQNPDRMARIAFHHVHRITKECQVVASNINEAISSRTAQRLGGSKAVRPMELAIWVFDVAMPEFNMRRGEVYVDARTPFASDFAKAIMPRTNQKEMYRYEYRAFEAAPTLRGDNVYDKVKVEEIDVGMMVRMC